MQWKAAGLALALAASSAGAGECREDVEDRLNVLAEGFDDQLRGTNMWSLSWGSIYATGGALQLGIALSLKGDDPARKDLLFGSVASIVGAASLYLLPLRFTVPLHRMRELWDNPDRCAVLRDAEAVRERVASEQGLGKSWIAHVGNVLVNLGIGLTLGLAFGHWQGGAISAGVGLAVGELNLLTAPTHLGRYAEPRHIEVVPVVGRDFNGVGLVVAF